VIYAFEQAGPEDRARLAALYGDGGPTDADVAEIVAILERTGARDYTRDQAAGTATRPCRAGCRRRRRPRGAGPLEEIIVSVIRA
jgi:hypothetical protein